jgi:hypothetical protein
VQQVPRHERGVAVGEVVLRAARTRVEVGRAGPASPIQPASACGGMVPGGEHGAYRLPGRSPFSHRERAPSYQRAAVAGHLLDSGHVSG